MDSRPRLFWMPAASNHLLSKIQVKARKKNFCSLYYFYHAAGGLPRLLHFPVKKTMSVAQQLYEGLELGELGPVGLITYMRTDSVRISEAARNES